MCYVTAKTVPEADEASVIGVEGGSAVEALCMVKDREVVVPVVNYGSKTIKLKTGSVVGHGRRIDSSAYYTLEPKEPRINQITVGDVEEKKKILVDDIKVNKEISSETVDALLLLLNEYRDVVSTSMMELGRTHLTEFRIEEIPGSSPVRCKPFRLSSVEREALKDILDQMKAAGMIEESRSAYASPVMLVRKPDGSWRMVIDYRKLNSQTVKASYPMPVADDIIDEVGERKYYSTFDLAHGYFQIPMDKESASKAAFVTADGHYQPRVMMMGLTAAPAAFQELMVKVKESAGRKQVHPYLDDLIAASDSEDEHLSQIASILESLRKAKLTISTKGCPRGSTLCRIGIVFPAIHPELCNHCEPTHRIIEEEC